LQGYNVSSEENNFFVPRRWGHQTLSPTGIKVMYYAK
jgi:hypothetical protein